MAGISEVQGFPDSIRLPIVRLAEEWFASPDRPRPVPEVAKFWDALVERWVNDPSCPLLIRKSTKTNPRGGEVQHPSGRTVVCVDNSPAHWTLASAIAGETPTLEGLRTALESGEWPVVFAMSLADVERLPRYRGILARSERAKELNKGRWKVCHIEEVGLRSKGGVESFPIDVLVEQCRRLLSPSNMFVVPNSHGGFGELPEVVEVFRRAVLR